jgi:hypothetical protein
MQSKYHTTLNSHYDLSKSPVYGNFLKACEQGQMDEIENIQKYLPREIESFVRTDNFYALKVAAQSHRLQILEYFRDLLPKSGFKTLTNKELSIYVWAAEEGHPLLLECLDHLMGPLNHVKAEQISLACQKAAERGHASVIEHIESVYSKQLAVWLDPRLMYCIASKHGHLNVLISLETLFSSMVVEMIEANGHEPFRAAAANDHLEILEHIEVIHPEFQEQNKSFVFLNQLALAYKDAKNAGHFSICEHLLELPYLGTHLNQKTYTATTFFPRAPLSLPERIEQVSEPRP